MRGAYETTCDFYTGPADTPPNNLIAANVPCRLVFQNKITPLTVLDTFIVGYVTSDLNLTWFPQVTFPPGGSATIDYNYGLRIAIPSGSGVQWVVMRSEEVIDPSGGDPYCRYHVTPTPFPFW